MSKEIIGLIPVKGASERVPMKNLSVIDLWGVVFQESFLFL